MCRFSWLVCLALFVPGVVQAQAYQCRAPDALLPAPAAKKPPSEPRRASPIAGYTLALSWSPEYCRSRKADRRDRRQCGGQDGSFAFILHGLWPETRTSAYPQYCKPTERLSVGEVKSNFCAMPSTSLMAHEWAKHGSCMTDAPEKYFRAARILFGMMAFPDMDRLSRRPLTAGKLREEFARSNPGIGRSSFVLDMNERGWLREVRVCLNKDFRPRPCPRWMRQPKPDAEVKIWRGA